MFKTEKAIENNKPEEKTEIVNSHQPVSLSDPVLASSDPATSPFSHKVPQDIKWNNVTLTIANKKILRNCWGEVPSGKTCAIMGASGAGKSSLLNVLAGRIAPSTSIAVTGRVSRGCLRGCRYRLMMAFRSMWQARTSIQSSSDNTSRT